MRYALVVVPTLVAIPDRTEEKFVDSAAFVHVGARITVQIAGQLLDDDEIRKGLFVEVFAPAVLTVLVTGGVKRLLGPVDECGDILVLLGFALVVLGVFVTHLDPLQSRIEIAFVEVGFDDVTALDVFGGRLFVEFVDLDAAGGALHLVAHLVNAQIVAVLPFATARRTVVISTREIDVDILRAGGEQHGGIVVVIIRPVVENARIGEGDMRTDQRLVHILRQQHPAFFLGMVESDRAELFGELHAERLFRKPPRRIAASAHLDRLAVLVPLCAVPELREPVTVEYQGVLRSTDNSHIRLEHLRAVVLHEYQRYVVDESMLGCCGDQGL